LKAGLLLKGHHGGPKAQMEGKGGKGKTRKIGTVEKNRRGGAGGGEAGAGKRGSEKIWESLTKNGPEKKRDEGGEGRKIEKKNGGGRQHKRGGEYGITSWKWGIPNLGTGSRCGKNYRKGKRGVITRG